SRSIAILEFASGKRSSLEDFSASDQIRILAMTASALSRQKNSEKAPVFFNKALELAQNNLTKDDPANRVLAIIGNNLASSLEVQASLTPIEKELMILAAKTARKYWEIAGTWLEVERAEYRLAHTFLKAGDLIQALEHAQTCLEITEANKAPALEFFFGYEALALVEKARGNNVGLSKAVEHAESFFDQLKEDDKTWCESTLKNIKIT
ncbi:MAG TPA: hypothetical protein VN132_12485, partial [Bdellovibrio sp.]|nr:hypothetical protein [Bdellovibrio sp.]